LSQADEAVLSEAATIGARVAALGSVAGGASVSGGASGLAALRSDVDLLLHEQAMIRSHLHVILSRLPAGGAAASSRSGSAHGSATPSVSARPTTPIEASARSIAASARSFMEA